jgi:hypothetical protein
LAFPGKTCYKPNQSIDTIVMATDSEVREFLEEICEISIPIENDFSVFEHANDSPKTCQFISTESFDWVPNKVIETFVIQADPFKVSFQ